MTFYSGMVWIVSALALVTYRIIGMAQADIPGVEELVTFLSSVDGAYIYLSAFIAIFIEGFYFVGSFFPGGTLVVILAILSQVTGPAAFLGTIAAIFIGWCLAGVVNILLAKTYHLKVARLEEDADYEVKDRPWATWFPAFRANYEVAQIAEGGNPLQVFLSSVRVKFKASMIAALCTLIVPLFVDIRTIDNEEGFVAVMVVAGISFIVGAVKLKRYYSRKS